MGIFLKFKPAKILILLAAVYAKTWLYRQLLMSWTSLTYQNHNLLKYNF